MEGGSTVAGVMTTVTEVSGGLLDVATEVVEFVMSNPLLMLGVGVTFALLAVKVIKKFF